MDPRHAEAMDRAVGKGLNDVAGRDFAHGFAEGIDLVVALVFGRPDIFPEELAPEGLTGIDPPEVHSLQWV